MLQNKLRYLLLLALVGLLSILYNEYYMGIIFLTITVMPFLLFALLCYIYGRISVELVPNVHVAAKGEGFSIMVQVDNPTIFPISGIKLTLTYKNTYSTRKYKKDFMVSVDSRTKSSVCCNALSEYSGNLEVTLKSIRIFDYLRIFSLRKKGGNKITIAVMPSFHELTQDRSGNPNRIIPESDYYSKVKSGNDPSEVFTIREYREGDRLQRIHWKLSMKQEQLMIKEFSEPLNCSVLLLLNMCIPEGESVPGFMDALLEAALSVSYTFLRSGQIHYFSWYDTEHGSCRRVRVMDEKDLYTVIDGLFHAKPYTAGTEGVHAYLAEHPNEQYSDFFYFTGGISEAEIDSLSLIKSMTRRLICVSDFITMTEEQQFPKEVIDHFYEMGIRLIPVDIGNIKNDMEQLILG